jgi:hypothetical protein
VFLKVRRYKDFEKARVDNKMISAEDHLWQKATDFIMRSGHTWGSRGGSQVQTAKKRYQIALAGAPRRPFPAHFF